VSMKLMVMVGVLVFGLVGCGGLSPSLQSAPQGSDTLSAKRYATFEGSVRKMTQDSLTIRVFGPEGDQTFKITPETQFSYRQTAQRAPKFSDLKLEDVVEIGYREPGVASFVMVSLNGYRR